MQSQIRELSLVDKGFLFCVLLLAFGFGMWIILNVFPQGEAGEAVSATVEMTVEMTVEYDILTFYDDDGEQITCVVRGLDFSCLR